MPRLPAIALLAAVLVAVGCTSGTTVTDEDDGSTVTLGLGEMLVVRLEANRTTPYTLGLGEAPEQLKLENAKYDSDFALPGMKGSGGTEVWEFLAVAPGGGALVVEMRGEFYDEATGTWANGTQEWWSVDVVVEE